MVNNVPKPINVMLQSWIGGVREIDPSIIKPAPNKQEKMVDYSQMHKSFCGYYDDGWMTRKQVNSWHTICKVAQKTYAIEQHKKAI